MEGRDIIRKVNQTAQPYSNATQAQMSYRDSLNPGHPSLGLFRWHIRIENTIDCDATPRDRWRANRLTDEIRENTMQTQYRRAPLSLLRKTNGALVRWH